MSAQRLLSELEKLGKVDAKTIAKIRRQIDDPKKSISVKSIVRFLIDNKYLTNVEGERLLRNTSVTSKPEYGQTTQPIDARNKELDTDDLLGDNISLPEPVSPMVAAPADAPRVEQRDVSWTIMDRSKLLQVSEQSESLLGEPRSLGRGQSFDERPFSNRENPEANPVIAPSMDWKKTQGNPWESKWLFLGFGLLALLAMTSIGLWWFLTRTSADEAFNAANKEFSDGHFAAARDAYQHFHENFPVDKNAPLAKTKAVSALLWSFYNTKNWQQTKKAAVDELPKLLKSENNQMSAIQDDLSAILPKTAFGLSQQAVEAATTAEKKALIAESDEVMVLINNPLIFPTNRLKLDYVQPHLADRQKNVDQVNYEVEREFQYEQGLVYIAEQTAAGDTNNASQKYHHLIQDYPILKMRQPLLDLVVKISEKESQLVVPVEVSLLTTTEDIPQKSLARALLVAQSGTENPALENKIVTYLINGVVYGLSAADGAVLWWRRVGFQTTIQPQWVGNPHQSDLIVCDESKNQLIRIASPDGRIAWRTEIGERFLKPAVTRGKIFVTTRGDKRSKILRINIDDGKVEAACQLPQLASVGPVAHPDIAILYQMGQHSSLYIISQEELKCVEVFNLGHLPDSIDADPFLISGNLCVLVNFAQHCQAHVLGFKQRGLEVFEAQPPFKMTDGKISQNVYRYGRSVIASSDSGDLRMYELAISMEGEESAATMQPQIAGKFSIHDGISNYFLVDRGDLYLANKGLTKFRIQRSQQTFDLRKAGDTADTFIGPVYAFENALVHLRRRFHSSMITAAAVNPETLEEIWRTDFAAPALDQVFAVENKLMALSEQGDLFELTAEAFQSGVVRPQVRGTAVLENLQFDQRLTLGDGTIVLCGQGSDRVLAYGPNQWSSASLNQMQSPANRPGGQPAAFGKYLLVPSLDGQVVRVNPKNGFLIGAPFQPAVNPNQAVHWTRPTVFEDQNTFVIGTEAGTIYSVEADGEKSLVRKGQIEGDAGFISPLVQIGTKVFGVCRDTNNDRVVSFNVFPELIAATTKTLDQPYFGHLTALGEQLFLVSADGNLVCFKPDLEISWQVPLVGKIAGQLLDAGGTILIAFDNGDIVRLNKGTGETIKTISLEQPLANPPVEYNGNWYVGDQNGVIHVIEPLQ